MRIHRTDINERPHLAAAGFESLAGPVWWQLGGRGHRHLCAISVVATAAACTAAAATDTTMLTTATHVAAFATTLAVTAGASRATTAA
jgi:hypothetical protein